MFVDTSFDLSNVRLMFLDTLNYLAFQQSLLPPLFLTFYLLAPLLHPLRFKPVEVRGSFSESY